MITVYYDGICGNCAREIAHYKRIAPEGVFIWQDITDPNTDLSKDQFSRSEGLRYLHAKDAEGRLHIGVDAFLLIWRHIKPWHYLAHIFSMPPLRQLAGYIYKIFADKRFKAYDHCQIALKEDQGK